MRKKKTTTQFETYRYKNKERQYESTGESCTSSLPCVGRRQGNLLYQQAVIF